MSRIAPSDQLAALIRAQIGALQAHRGADPKKSSRRTSSPERRSADSIAATAAERVRKIAPDDPQRRDKAIRIFLECVLVGELGQTLITDPAFGRMVDHVQEQLRSDPELAAATSDLANVLLNGNVSKA